MAGSCRHALRTWRSASRALVRQYNTATTSPRPAPIPAAAPPCSLVVCLRALRDTLTLFPTHMPLALPTQPLTRALASPHRMNVAALSAGLPALVTHARVISRGTLTYISRTTAPPTRQQIDAALRRCMDAALASYTTYATRGALSSRFVILSALQITGRNIPALAAVFVADSLQRSTSHCLAPPVPSSAVHVSPPPLLDALRESHSWTQGLAVLIAEVQRSVTIVFHVTRLAVLFTPLLATAPLVFYVGIGRAAWMDLLRATMEVAGPAFIKWSQWAATRQDMFPPDLCASLAKLQASAPSHSWAFTKATLEESFGLPLDELCEWIDHKPVASGSIGQVHKAALSARGAEVCGVPAGRVVAMKVKHPHVSTSIQRDFGIMMWVASQLEWIPALRRLRIQESLSQFAAPLREQVDLALEANSLWRFNQNFSGDTLVSLPMPLYPWVSQDVLVQSFEEGMHISDYMAADADTIRRGAVAGVGSHCMLSMMLIHNLIHSDLHPGNILVRWQLPDGWLIGAASVLIRRLSTSPPEEVLERWLQPHIVLLDVGMATQLTNADRNTLLALFKSFIELDGPNMARSALAFAGPAQRCIDHDGFADAIDKKVDTFRVDTWAESEYESSAAAFASILDLVREYEVTLPGHICAVLITVLVLEGWSSKLSPERSLLEEVKAVIAMDTRSWRDRMSTVVDRWIDWGPVLPSLDFA